jgi:L-rhamnose isomerase / sugar isomerase
MRSNSMRAGTVFYQDRSIPISFKIRNTSTDRSGIPMNPSDNVHCGTRKTASKSLTASRAETSLSGLQMDQIIPGPANIRQRKQWFEEALREAHRALSPDQRMLVEYKPFEPAFYHTDIADWGMALLLSRAAGPQAKVLVDTGHHYAAQNIEQVVAWLLSEEMLGGFHFNDRRYADDDLTMGSIDPYQVFRIFHEIRFFEWETGQRADIAYMVDQSHNLKGKIEAMIQTVTMAQQLFAKAALVDGKKLAAAQKDCDLVAAESLLQDAFAIDVRAAIQDWRVSKGLPKDPLAAFRQSGYLERITKERAARNSHSVTSYA